MTGYILAGGKSSRMGVDKGLLPLEGKPLVLHLLERLQRQVDEVVILTNQLEDYGFLAGEEVYLKKDIIPGKGPIGGIFTGLSTYGDGFFISCDLPFFNEEMIPFMWENLEAKWGCFPCEKGFYEPLCGIYTQKMLPEIERRIHKNELRLQQLIASFEERIHVLEKEGLRKLFGEYIFLNMNTKEMYNRLIDEGKIR